MSAVAKLGYLLLGGLVLAAQQAHASNVDEAPIGEAVERHLSIDTEYQRWVQDPDDVDTEIGDEIETRETLEDALETVKLSGLVPDIRFETGVAQIPDSTVVSLGEILDRMKDRINVRLHLIGHADSQPLSPRLQAIYGDNNGLSRERAGQVAEHFQTALALPPEAISYEWAGDTQPVASNETAEGRAQNRRVEVEVWYDEVVDKVALEEFLVPHEIKRVKVCRMETVCKLRYVEGHSKRARVQNLIAPLRYSEDAIDVTPEFVAQVRQSLDNMRDKQNVVVKFVGYTDAAPLTGRTERIYGDHVGLSKARARRVALAVQDSLNLPTAAIASNGEGAIRPLGSNQTLQGRPSRKSTIRPGARSHISNSRTASRWCRRVTKRPSAGHWPMSPTRPMRGCGSWATRATNASTGARPRCTATTLACPHPARGVRWRRLPPAWTLTRTSASSRAAVTCTPTTWSMPASCRAIPRTSRCRSCTTSSQSLTITRASTSLA
jgi:flagellar motor protein MotB